MIKVRFHLKNGSFVEVEMSRGAWHDMKLPGCTINLHGEKSFKINGDYVLYTEEVSE